MREVVEGREMVEVTRDKGGGGGDKGQGRWWR